MEQTEEGWVNLTLRLRPSEVKAFDELLRKQADRTGRNVSRQNILRGWVIKAIARAG